MTDKPTKAQVKELWEGCGFKLRSVWDDIDPTDSDFDADKFGFWEYPNGIIDGYLPPIDLNNLFQYAVHGKLMKDGYQGAQEMLEEWIANFTGNYEKDALALFWAIYPVITGKEVIHERI